MGPVPLTRREGAALAILLAAAAAGLSYRAFGLVRDARAHSVVTVCATGAVAVPGRFQMPAGSTVADLFAVASLLPAADTSALSGEVVLSDAQCVDVPWKEGEGGQAAPSDAGLVDVNSAPAYLLERLPGIGPVLARAIVEHRAAHGPFTCLGELESVPGIGPATVRGLEGLAVARLADGGGGSRPPR